MCRFENDESYRAALGELGPGRALVKIRYTKVVQALRGLPFWVDNLGFDSCDWICQYLDANDGVIRIDEDCIKRAKYQVALMESTCGGAVAFAGIIEVTNKGRIVA